MRILAAIIVLFMALIATCTWLPMHISIGERSQSGYDGVSRNTEADVSRAVQAAQKAADEAMKQ